MSRRAASYSKADVNVYPSATAIDYAVAELNQLVQVTLGKRSPEDSGSDTIHPREREPTDDCAAAPQGPHPKQANVSYLARSVVLDESATDIPVQREREHTDRDVPESTSLGPNQSPSPTPSRHLFGIILLLIGGACALAVMS
jgi:hypothetical protein